MPLLEGYAWRAAASATGGITGAYTSLRLRDAAGDLQAEKYNAILVTGWHKHGMLQCLRAAVHSSKPVLVRAESNGLAPVSLLQRLKAKWLLGGVTRLLPIGTANRLYYERLGLAARIGDEVPYFVDNAFFSTREQDARARRDDLRRGFGIPLDAGCFLFAGKFVNKKRPRDVLAALARLSSGQGKSHLLMVGSGELEAQLRQEARTRGLSVSFAGFLNQSGMPEAYAVADCLVLPSDYGETWGLVVNEAMACGLPAIVSDHVGCGPDLIRDAETGWIFSYGDTDALAASMSRFMELNPLARETLSANARGRVTKGHSIERARDGTLAAVLGALSAR